MGQQKTVAIVIATFKGRRGSEGYYTGHEYVLRVTEDYSQENVIKIENESTALRNMEGKTVEYHSVFKFLENWIIKNISVK